MLACEFITRTPRSAKPRSKGVTEIRGPYYTAMGRRYLEDVLETAGLWVDSLKYAGGSFAVMPADRVRELNDLAHRHDVEVSTGGFIERVLVQGSAAVDRYLEECLRLGFDIVEISAGFIALAEDDLFRLVERVREVGLRPKPEVGIQFGAGGHTEVADLSAESARDPSLSVALARRLVDAGAERIMIESEGITESVASWRTDVPARFVAALGLEHVMFEAADPPVFEWYIKTFGPDVSLFVDHSQIVQLECLRQGLWGTQGTWGRVAGYAPTGSIPAPPAGLVHSDSARK